MKGLSCRYFYVEGGVACAPIVMLPPLPVSVCRQYGLK